MPLNFYVAVGRRSLPLRSIGLISARTRCGNITSKRTKDSRRIKDAVRGQSVHRFR